MHADILSYGACLSMYKHACRADSSLTFINVCLRAIAIVRLNFSLPLISPFRSTESWFLDYIMTNIITLYSLFIWVPWLAVLYGHWYTYHYGKWRLTNIFGEPNPAVQNIFVEVIIVHFCRLSNICTTRNKMSKTKQLSQVLAVGLGEIFFFFSFLIILSIEINSYQIKSFWVRSVTTPLSLFLLPKF